MNNKATEQNNGKNNGKEQPTMMRKALSFFTDFFTTFQLSVHKKALGIIAMGLAFLSIFWAGMYLIDFQNIFGISSDRGFWWHAFRNRGPVEIGQWAVMSLVVVTSGRIAGIYEERKDRSGKILWLLIAATFAMMIIEDAGDPRHIQGRYFVHFWDR